jgi:hypothetical protein
MGVRTLIGTADGTRHAAAMYDSTNGLMLGDLFEADDAEDQIDAFQAWLARYPFAADPDAIGLEPNDAPGPSGDGSDVRHWPDSGLKKLLAYWRRHNLNEHGELAAPEGDPA